MTTQSASISPIASRPTHVSHRNIDLICDAMRAAGRTELLHYAGSCYRDDTAWQVCKAWMDNHDADEATLLSIAYRATGWGDISPDAIRRARSVA